jgi:hypothetical protein
MPNKLDKSNVNKLSLLTSELDYYWLVYTVCKLYNWLNFTILDWLKIPPRGYFVYMFGKFSKIKQNIWWFLFCTSLRFHCWPYKLVAIVTKPKSQNLEIFVIKKSALNMGEDKDDLLNSDELRDANAYLRRKDELSNTSL